MGGTKTTNLEGVVIEALRIIADERGKVMHMMRSDGSLFQRFGEIYFSVVNPGYIKGWKKHLKQTQHFAVPSGEVRLVLYDDRNQSLTKHQFQEIILGVNNYHLVRIPPQIWYSFAAQGNQPAMIANLTDIPHDSKESLQLDICDQSIPYSWDLMKP